jgi:DNA-binding MarR family transcriptional regulator
MTHSIFRFDKPEKSPGLLLWQTTIIWQRLVKNALESYDISHSQFVILAITLWFESKNQNPSQTDIIQLSKLDKMTVSKALKKLVGNNLIKRSEHKEDSRAKSVLLSKKGKELILTLIPIVETIDHDFFGTLKKTDRECFMSNLLALQVDA